MLTRFEVRGFKSLVNATVDLGAVNIFIGANGSGKSNLLEAIGFLGAVSANGPEAESFRYRGIRLGVPSSFVSALVQHDLSEIFLSASKNDSKYEGTFVTNSKRNDEWSIELESIRLKGEVLADRNEEGLFVFGFDNPRPRPFHSLPSMKSINPFTELFFAMYRQEKEREHERGGNEEAISDINVEEYLYMINQLESYAIFTPSTPQLRGFLDDIQREPIGLGGSRLGRAIEEMVTIQPLPVRGGNGLGSVGVYR